MTDAQAALAQVREALADPMLFDWARDWDRARAIRAFERSCTTANIAAIIAHVDAQAAENERLTAERDDLRRQLAEARAEREAMANVLPGHCYMDPPDGGDVPVLEQLRRMAKDAARYRFLSCKGVPPYAHRCSRWRLEYWNGEWWDPLMKEELDAAIDAQIEKEERP